MCRHAQVCVVSLTGWHESGMWRLACRYGSLVLTPCWSLAGWECTVTLAWRTSGQTKELESIRLLQRDMFMHGVYRRQCLLVLDTAARGILWWLHTAYSKDLRASCLLRQSLMALSLSQALVCASCRAACCLGFSCQVCCGDGIARPVCALCRLHWQ